MTLCDTWPYKEDRGCWEDESVKWVNYYISLTVLMRRRIHEEILHLVSDLLKDPGCDDTSSSPHKQEVSSEME